MYIARTIVLFACIIALASAGAVRSSTKPQNNNDVVEMDKENVETLTSNLVKAATDKSSPNLSRKANETVEAMFSKMKSEENNTSLRELSGTPYRPKVATKISAYGLRCRAHATPYSRAL